MLESIAFVIGVDLGDVCSEYCVIGAQDGRFAEGGRMATDPGAMREFLRQWPRGTRVVIEVGSHSPWVARAITTAGHDAVVADPRRVLLIARGRRKCDRVDAEVLARLGRSDVELLAPISHRGPQAQTDRALLRARDALVRARSLLVNTVRGVVKPLGERVGKCSVEAFPGRARQDLSAPIRALVEGLLEQIQALTAQIARYQKRIESVAQERYPETRRLTQVAGVGVLTALAFVLAIEDVGRFGNVRRVGAYLGLTPKRSQSGANDPELPISKAGDAYVRRLLVGSAHYILGPFGPHCDLRRWGLAKAAGGKSQKRRAVVAVARKLAVLLASLWKSGETYDPFRNAERLDQAA